MKHFAVFFTSVLATLWLSAGKVIIAGNFTQTNLSADTSGISAGLANLTSINTNLSALAHGPPRIDGTVYFTDNPDITSLCSDSYDRVADPGPYPIRELDCHAVIARIRTVAGYWTIKGFKSCETTDCGILAWQNTCAISVARIDNNEDEFYIGTDDAVRFIERSLNKSTSPLFCPRVVSEAICVSGDNTIGARICAKLHVPDRA
ncbi:uncharacterized protein PG998_015055 [Apiospora kogelbergensis]|uniref:uncharacterized protein n=1 Tax=Apiospora kogelbergensis TaxID=1337665 RepID=UPI00312E08F9